MINTIRDFFLHDFWLKLFSLALAVLIWLIVNFAVQRGPATPRSFIPTEQRVFSNLPIVILASAEDVRSVKVHPKEVELTVQGDSRALKQLQVRDLRVLVDITGIEAAQGLRKRLEVSTPPGVTYVRIEPEEVQVIFPPKTEKNEQP
jgi:YbbR domain-containing protein